MSSFLTAQVHTNLDLFRTDESNCTKQNIGAILNTFTYKDRGDYLGTLYLEFSDELNYPTLKPQQRKQLTDILKRGYCVEKAIYINEPNMALPFCQNYISWYTSHTVVDVTYVHSLIHCSSIGPSMIITPNAFLASETSPDS